MEYAAQHHLLNENLFITFCILATIHISMEEYLFKEGDSFLSSFEAALFRKY